jgi:hypothetical protein
MIIAGSEVIKRLRNLGSTLFTGAFKLRATFRSAQPERM